MSTTERTSSFEIIDHNIIPDLYVIYIVDLWLGSRHDPATEINRYIGVWSYDSLDDQDPDFANAGIRYWSFRQFKPPPIHWEQLERVKEGERDAAEYRSQQENMLAKPEEGGYRSYGRDHTRDKLYQGFMEAIDTLAEKPEDEEAWEAIDKWRTHQAQKHEK